MLFKYVIMSANEGIILLQNIRSIRQNFDEFVEMISALDVTTVVICSTETWLNENCDTHCSEIKGSQNLIACNKETKGGGVAIDVQKILNGIKYLATETISVRFCL